MFLTVENVDKHRPIFRSPNRSMYTRTPRILNSNNIMESIQNMKNEFRVSDLQSGCFTKKLSG